MRVLLANKFFYDHGGPESVLFATRDLLIDAGHDVIDFSMQDARNRPSPYASYFSSNMDLQSVRPSPSSIRTALRFLDSGEAAANMRRLIRDHRPDIAHLHSINHQLTPSIVRVLKAERIPTVMTLHDYKLVCPAYTMLANGGVCENCSGGKFYRALTTNCRGRARSALLTAESYLQHRVRRSYDGVSLFIAPSAFLADKFREMGFGHPIEVLPNPATHQESGIATGKRGDHFLFVGRVVAEKGLRTLCTAAVVARVRVVIAGDGPQLDQLQTEFGANANIEFAGRVAPQDAQKMMAEARAVVVPSEWYENQPMVILEAFAQRTPVIASDIGGNPELVQEGETGLLHKAGSVGSLADKLRWAATHNVELEQMGDRAQEFAAKYSPERHLERLLAMYARVLGETHGARHSREPSLAKGMK
jgi:glycosyltransferase involved in cell wall biosynthesis